MITLSLVNALLFSFQLYGNLFPSAALIISLFSFLALPINYGQVFAIQVCLCWHPEISLYFFYWLFSWTGAELPSFGFYFIHFSFLLSLNIFFFVEWKLSRTHMRPVLSIRISGEGLPCLLYMPRACICIFPGFICFSNIRLLMRVLFWFTL